MTPGASTAGSFSCLPLWVSIPSHKKPLTESKTGCSSHSDIVCVHHISCQKLPPAYGVFMCSSCAYGSRSTRTSDSDGRLYTLQEPGGKRSPANKILQTGQGIKKSKGTDNKMTCLPAERGWLDEGLIASSTDNLHGHVGLLSALVVHRLP